MTAASSSISKYADSCFLFRLKTLKEYDGVHLYQELDWGEIKVKML